MNKDEILQAFVDLAKMKVDEHRGSKPTADYRDEQFSLLEIKEVLEDLPPQGVWTKNTKGEWIEIKYRKPTEEEKERYPEAEEWFDCELPEHGEEVLVTTAYNNLIAMTTFANYGDDGCEFEDYDAEDIIAWCRLPEPYIAEMRGEE